MSNKIEFSADDFKYFMNRWNEVYSEVEDEEFHRIVDSGNQVGDKFFEDCYDKALNKLLDEIRHNKIK